jgi:predicted phage terminase large subunit-like protein
MTGSASAAGSCVLLTDYKARLGDLWRKCPDDEVTQLSRLLCRTDLYFLLRYGLNRADAEHQWIFDRCAEVQAEPDGRLDLWSREHYKSAIITFTKTIQDILVSHGDGGQGREVCVGIFGHTRGVAKRFLRQIKYEFESNDKLKEWFPDILYANPSKEAPKWSEDDGIVVKRKSNPPEATVEAWGVVDGQPIGKHFPLLVYDDVVVPESVTTPEMIAKTTDMLALSYALGAEGGRCRMIGTRYHQNDSYRVTIDRGTFKPRIHLLTKDGTANGDPVLRSKEWVQDKRRDMGPYLFSSQMLQNPSADEAQGFKEAWLKYHDGVPRAGLNVYLVFDPAGSKNKGSDYTAGWAVGLGPDGNMYVLDMVRDRLNLTQRAALLMRWHRKWKPQRQDGVRYEKYGLQSDIEHFETVMRSSNYRFDLTEVAGLISKNERIKRLIPYFEQCKVFLPRTLYYTNYEGKTHDLVQSFIQEEYKPFPVSLHDDMFDALARMLEPDYPLIWPEIHDFPMQLEPEATED